MKAVRRVKYVNTSFVGVTEWEPDGRGVAARGRCPMSRPRPAVGRHNAPEVAASWQFGLPQVIRTDNGVPFASAHATYCSSKLAVWWLRLGIQIERIKPGHPQQNRRMSAFGPPAACIHITSKCRFATARPEPDFRYFSKRTAEGSS